jgi:hypothetical protein
MTDKPMTLVQELAAKISTSPEFSWADSVLILRICEAFSCAFADKLEGEGMVEKCADSYDKWHKYGTEADHPDKTHSPIYRDGIKAALAVVRKALDR